MADDTNKKSFPCQQCGAVLSFKPGSTALACEYCGHENPIEQTDVPVKELDFDAFAHLDEHEDDAATMEATVVACSACAAEVQLEANVTAGECPFCGTHVVLEGGTKQLIKPESMLPFKVTREEASKAFRDWIGGLWFAPSNLKDRARDDKGISGVYLPHWTYDSDTRTWYRGERGVDYKETETYQDKDAEGNSVTKTREVTKTRWYPCSGVVYKKFDDVMVVASHSLPVKYVKELEPWDLENLTPYQDDYLSGFKAESYTVGLKDGFGEAQEIMKPTISAAVKRDIGGDHQRVHHMDTGYHDVTFKHILLPVWMNAYRYEDQVYRFVVNARTGEVQGERPYSKVKIALAILAVLIIIGLIIFAAKSKGNKGATTSMLDGMPTTQTTLTIPAPEPHEQFWHTEMQQPGHASEFTRVRDLTAQVA